MRRCRTSITCATIIVIALGQGCDSGRSWGDRLSWGENHRVEKAWLDLVKSEWGSCPVEGKLNVEIVEYTDDPLSELSERISHPKAGSTFQIEFYIESREVFRVTARDDDKTLVTIVADGSTYTFDSRDKFSIQRLWDEEDYDELARLWPLNIVTAHLFPASHDLLLTLEGAKAIQNGTVTSAREDQDANADTVDTVIRGRARETPFWGYTFEFAPNPRVLKRQDYAEGEVIDEKTFSVPLSGVESNDHPFMRYATWHLVGGWKIRSELEELRVNVRKEE